MSSFSKHKLTFVNLKTEIFWYMNSTMAWLIVSPVTYFTKEVNSSLAKPPLNSNGNWGTLELTFFME